MSSSRPRKFDLTFLCELDEWVIHVVAPSQSHSSGLINLDLENGKTTIYIEEEALRYEDLNINKDFDHDDDDDNDDEDLETENVTIVLARMFVSRDFCVRVLYDVVVGMRFLEMWMKEEEEEEEEGVRYCEFALHYGFATYVRVT
ncbi:hypothetical protein L1887_28624 [Cichorium endivia]|nr:hypothetical protein L1887_28624 [Cichorium endivia]